MNPTLLYILVPVLLSALLAYRLFFYRVLNMLGRAAKRGDVAAQFRLGLIYARGLGVHRDPVKALAWLTIASSHGHQEAEKQMVQLSLQLSESQLSCSQRLADAYSPAETGFSS